MTITARGARAAQIQRDRETMRAITQDYLDVWRSVRADLDELNHQIMAARQAGKTVSPSWLYRQERYKTLLAGIEQRVGQFTDATARRVYGEMLRARSDGGRDAMALLQASLPEGVSFAFTAPPLAAFEALSRQTLGKLFAGYGREAALKARAALLQGMARGQSPAVIARAVREAMGGPLWKALRISRTEVMSAYRQSSGDTYRANQDVLAGWVWTTGPSPCPFCASQSGKLFSVDAEMDTHPNCFPAGVLASGPRVVASTQRWYSGRLVEIETASGKFLPVTPNHPILTPDGWVAAGELVEGGYVISRASGKWPPSCINPYEYQIPTLIEEVAATLGSALEVTSVGVPGSAQDFHGDGISGKVSTIRANSQLWNHFDTTLAEPSAELAFIRRSEPLSALPALSAATEIIPGTFLPTNGGVGSLSLTRPFLRREISDEQPVGLSHATSRDASPTQARDDSRPRDAIGSGQSSLGLASKVSGRNFFSRQGVFSLCVCGHLRASGSTPFSVFGGDSDPRTFSEVANADTVSLQEPSERGASDVKFTRQSAQSFSALVARDQIIHVRRREFRGHVYNLQTITGWYLANDIVTHNCRCTMVPSTKGWSEILASAAYWNRRPLLRWQDER